MVLRKLAIAFVLLSFSCLTPSFAQDVKLINQFQSKDWTAHIYQAKDKRVCFATSEPKIIKPENVKRGKILFYISSWPDEKVRNEISIQIGYPLKPNSETIAEIDSQAFKLFVDGEKAFVKSPEEERKLVEAIKRGSAMVVKGVSVRGTLTTDEYSLSGVSNALKKVSQNCP